MNKSKARRRQSGNPRARDRPRPFMIKLNGQDSQTRAELLAHDARVSKDKAIMDETERKLRYKRDSASPPGPKTLITCSKDETSEQTETSSNAA